MAGSLARTLAGLVLTIAASSVFAQPVAHSTEYRWLTLFGAAEYPVPASQARAARPGSLLETVLRRAFITVDSGYLSSPASRDFRRPDPEFGDPAALRRPRQARLAFSIRF